MVMDILVMATRNRHKTGEIQSILGDGFRYLALTDVPGAPEVVEDAGTFAGNATKKAVALAKWLTASGGRHLTGPPAKAWVLADDSGLEVDALNGAPGVHSARFAALETGRAGNSADSENLTRLLKLLGEVPAGKRGARFKCVLALTQVLSAETTNASPTCYADEFEMGTELFEGVCEGRIGFEPKGAGGFGYDPVFIPEGYEQTFAELGEEIKNRMSHRARALARLKLRLQ
ncbi:MAG TPA: non-canonical purine NTP pyrophosphatase [Methylomirabilota bacterium]|nr:non-canonical purine NTP pyrophosphatase [Methylomirabilota bacterium]